MNQDIEFYNTVSTDSMSWLDNSEKLKLSADLINKELEILIEPFRQGKRDYKNEEKIQAFWNSYFLLIGHAFENLIKGLSIEKNRDLKTFDEIYKKKWKDYKSGHGISKIAKDNLSDLEENEIKLLEKLETYIVWAGKYPLPKQINEYNTDKPDLFFGSNDNRRFNDLFVKIKNRLDNEWEKNESK